MRQSSDQDSAEVGEKTSGTEPAAYHPGWRTGRGNFVSSVGERGTHTGLQSLPLHILTWIAVPFIFFNADHVASLIVKSNVIVQIDSSRSY